MRSEPFAERVGRISGRIVTWARGVVNRPSSTDFAALAVRFRAETLETVRGMGLLLLGVIFLKYVANAATLIFALRAVGVPADALTIAGAFAAYSVVRLVTVVEITPGGVGVVEVAYTAALSYVTTGDYHAAIVAGVLLFRLVTYIAADSRRCGLLRHLAEKAQLARRYGRRGRGRCRGRRRVRGRVARGARRHPRPLAPVDAPTWPARRRRPRG